MWKSTQLSMLFFDTDNRTCNIMKCLWGSHRATAKNTLLKRNKIRLLPILLQWHFCLSIFLTNAHKLVFRFYHQKCTTRQSTLTKYLKQRARSSDYLALVSLSDIFPCFFSCSSFFILLFCYNCCRCCHYGSDYIYEALRTHLVNSLIFHLPFRIVSIGLSSQTTPK